MQVELDKIDESSCNVYIGIGRGNSPTIEFLPTTSVLRAYLLSAQAATLKKMRKCSPEPTAYDASNEHLNETHERYDWSGDSLPKAQVLWDASVGAATQTTQEHLSHANFYLLESNDSLGNRLIAVKITNGFGVKTKRPIFAKITGAGLDIVTEPEFRLADNFDFFIDQDAIYIHRASTFENAFGLLDLVRDSALTTIDQIASLVTWVDFGTMKKVVKQKARMARLMHEASQHGYFESFEQDQLKQTLEDLGIEFELRSDQIIVEKDSHAEAMLEVVCRHILEVRTSSDLVEVYHAPNRRKYIPPLS